ncbi:hypothetical protein SDC9_72060 [bioreactor metagenome]|uniref:RNA polymerase sigma factor 70 region 4 type 2 domain-containing protein n=1 Tax=bioreactor metagenome TaxID=1076179 RepID=A0A644YHH7_9ZZZZ
MPDTFLMKKQIANLSAVTANELYSLALYSVQSAPLAHSLAVDAFAVAYKSDLKQKDVAQFKVLCAGLLYLGAKKALQDQGSGAPLPAPSVRQAPIHRLLYTLEFDERFLLLLFMHKYTQRQMAQILRLPELTVKIKVELLLTKTKELWDAASENEQMKLLS